MRTGKEMKRAASERAFGAWAAASKAVAGAVGAAGAMGIPVQPAMAADIGGTIGDLFGKARDSVLYPIYIGLLSCVGLVALIVLIVEIVQGATAPAGRNSDHIKQCIIIIIICVVLGFAPALLNYMLELGGGASQATVSVG